MLNGIATLLYGGSLLVPRLTGFGGPGAMESAGMTTSTTNTTSTAAIKGANAESFSFVTFVVLIVLASVTSLVGTLCLLAIVAEYTGVMAVVVTSLRKTLTILLSFVLYGRPFTLMHATGLLGVMGGVVWNELLRRQRKGVGT